MANANLVVLVEPAVAQALRQGRAHSGPAKDIADIVESAGRALTPLHEESANSVVPQEMLSSFVVTAAAGSELDKLAEQLRSLPGVEAAYVKPRDEPP